MAGDNVVIKAARAEAVKAKLAKRAERHSAIKCAAASSGLVGSTK
jgi:hypothetical protein